MGVLLRDIVATVAFLATLFSHRPRAIPARAGGKAVTVAQMLTLVAFLTGSPLLQPMAWATAAIAVYAIWDYYRVAPAAERRVGGYRGMTAETKRVTMAWERGLVFRAGRRADPRWSSTATTRRTRPDADAAPRGRGVQRIRCRGHPGEDAGRAEAAPDRAQRRPAGAGAEALRAIRFEFHLAGDGLDETRARRAIDLSLEKYCSVVASLAPDIQITYGLTLA